MIGQVSTWGEKGVLSVTIIKGISFTPHTHPHALSLIHTHTEADTTATRSQQTEGWFVSASGSIRTRERGGSDNKGREAGSLREWERKREGWKIWPDFVLPYSKPMRLFFFVFFSEM
jgi:hypothetical protein